MRTVNVVWLAAAAVVWAGCGRTAQLVPEGDFDGGVNLSGGSSTSNSTGGTPIAGNAGAGGFAAAGGATIVGGTTGAGGSMGIDPTAGVIIGRPGMGVTGGAIIIGPGGILIPGGGNNSGGPAPEGCVTASETSSSTDCQLQLSCTNDQIFTYCYLDSGSNWSCGCNSNYRSMSFQTSGSDSSAVCNSISEICSSADPLASASAESCTTDYQSQGTDNCDLGKNCVRTIDAANGTTAQVSSYKSSNCYSDGSGQLICQCSNGQVYRSYELSGISIADSCSKVIDLCDSGADPVFNDPAACTDTYQDANYDYCYQEQQCRSTASVSSGVTAIRDDYRYVSCQDLGTGSASCDCSGSEGYMQFETVGTAADLNTCSNALQICSSADAIALSGPIECARNYQSASSSSCDSQLTCKQAGSLDGQQLLVYGNLYVSCYQQTTGGPWSCNCSSGQESASYQVDAGDGWDLCSMYADSCQTAIDIKIGMSSGGGYYYGGFPIAFSAAK